MTKEFDIAEVVEEYVEEHLYKRAEGIYPALHSSATDPHYPGRQELNRTTVSVWNSLMKLIFLEDEESRVLYEASISPSGKKVLLGAPATKGTRESQRKKRGQGEGKQTA